MIRILVATSLSIAMIGCSGQQHKNISIDAPTNTTNINVTVTQSEIGDPPLPPPPSPPSPPTPPQDPTVKISGVVDRIEQFLSPSAIAQEGDALLHLNEIKSTGSEYDRGVGILLRRCSPFFILTGQAESGDKLNISLGKHDEFTYNGISILVPNDQKIGKHSISFIGKAMVSTESLEFACGTRKYFVQEGEQE